MTPRFFVIEPSVVGGGKVARAIGAKMVEGATSGS